MSQQHNMEQEDDEEEVTEMELSYKCMLYVGEVPPHFVAIGRLYPGASTMHIVQMPDDLARVVVKDIRSVKVKTDLILPISSLSDLSYIRSVSSIIDLI